MALAETAGGRTGDRAAAGADGVGRELEELSAAVGTLRDACGRLQGSVAGINDDLESTNARLAVAARTHAAAAAYLENILANVQCGVIAVDGQGTIVLFNEAAEAITGLSGERAVGASYLALLGREGQEKVTPLYTLATGCPIEEQEKTVTAASGEAIPVSCSTSVLIDRDNRVVGAIEVLTDLRRMKQLEQEVARVKRLAAVGEVAAEVAHEVRNPLSGIKGFVGLLERDLAGNQKCLPLVGKIKEGIAALERIASDLLEAGKPMTLDRKRIDLIPQLERVIELFEMATAGDGRKIAFRLAAGDGPFYCSVEPERIRQAVTNLVANAVEAAGDRGTVTVEVYATGQCGGESRDQSGVAPRRELACIAVSDTGPGMSEEVRDRMFSPFFTTRADGTGLGLHLARKIANLHGGDLRYSSGEAGGSRFVIEIPRW
jgi:two-component system nitrogen regulation sensor histidine kinase GlnL